MTFRQLLPLIGMILHLSPLSAQRAIHFGGIENARDMGGLVMQDGRTIRPGKLIRSGHLGHATDSDLVVLQQRYGLTDVFDFRFEAEATSAPDRFMDGVSYTHLSTLPPALLAAFAPTHPDTSQVDMTDILAVLAKYALAPQAQVMARRLYPAIVSDSVSQQRYGRFLRGVLSAEGGVLWHCSQGKDRAGWASAFVLAALGADRDVIVADFNLSNQSYAAQVEALSAKVCQQGGGDDAVAFIQAMVGVSRENFESTLDLIDRQYGSLADYLEHQLGFSEQEQRLLREKYLQQ